MLVALLHTGEIFYAIIFYCCWFPYRHI